MKKNLRKILSTALVLILTLSLSLTAFAAGITSAQAKEIALKDAGYSASDVVKMEVELDFDDGVKKYEVEFEVYTDSLCYEFEYDIRFSDGKILKKEVETERIKYPGGTTVKPSAPSQAKDIGKDAALNAAYAAFGFSANEVKLIEVKKDYEDGVLVYEIEFAKGYECEYSCDVVAATGAVIDMETDVSENIFDMIELFFKVLFAQLFG